MLYTKHFYGFEKEGKTEHYNEKSVVATTFDFRYPMRLVDI